MEVLAPSLHPWRVGQGALHVHLAGLPPIEPVAFQRDSGPARRYGIHAVGSGARDCHDLERRQLRRAGRELHIDRGLGRPVRQENPQLERLVPGVEKRSR